MVVLLEHQEWIYVVFYRCLGLAILTLLYYLGNGSNHAVEPANTAAHHRRNSHGHSTCLSKTCLRCNAMDSLSGATRTAKQLTRQTPAKLKRIKQWLLLHGTTGCNQQARQQPTVFCLPEVNSIPIVKRKRHKRDVTLLENSWRAIEKEYLSISQASGVVSGWKTNSTPQGCWSTFYLYNQGAKVCENANRCPVTMQLLTQLEDLMLPCGFGNVCFSCVEPGTTIAAHHGPCNVRTRCHLGLLTPPGFELNVDEDTLSWNQGECLLFDDSYLHSVTFKSDYLVSSLRVIFMVDLWHFDLTVYEREALKLMFPPR